MDIQKPYSVDVDLQGRHLTPSGIQYFRGDLNAYPLTINLLSRKTPYPIADNVCAYIVFKLENGVSDEGEAEIISCESGILQYKIKGSEISLVGKVKASVILRKKTGDGKLTFPAFTFEVLENLDAGGVQPTGDFVLWRDRIERSVSALESNVNNGLQNINIRSPRIGPDGTWIEYRNDAWIDTKVKAEAIDGRDGENGKDGETGPPGKDGKNGDQGPKGDPALVSVKDFGAVGDGVTDDTDALQAAFDHCEQNKVACFIPCGTYIFSKTLMIPSITIQGEATKGARPEIKVTSGKYVHKSPYHPYNEFFILPKGWVVTNQQEANGYTTTFKIRDVIFGLSGNGPSDYERKITSLFGLAYVKDCVFTNCDFSVDSQGLPPDPLKERGFTPLDLYHSWQNIRFENCNIYATHDKISGGVWVRNYSANRKDKLELLSGAYFDNCTFHKCGGDEVIAIWGWLDNVHMTNCKLYQHDSEHYNPAHMLSIGLKTGEDCDYKITNVYINKCEIHMESCGHSIMSLGENDLQENVHIDGNTVAIKNLRKPQATDAYEAETNALIWSKGAGYNPTRSIRNNRFIINDERGECRRKLFRECYFDITDNVISGNGIWKICAGVYNFSRNRIFDVPSVSAAFANTVIFDDNNADLSFADVATIKEGLRWDHTDNFSAFNGTEDNLAAIIVQNNIIKTPTETGKRFIIHCQDITGANPFAPLLNIDFQRNTIDRARFVCTAAGSKMILTGNTLELHALDDFYDSTMISVWANNLVNGKMTLSRIDAYNKFQASIPVGTIFLAEPNTRGVIAYRKDAPGFGPDKWTEIFGDRPQNIRSISATTPITAADMDFIDVKGTGGLEITLTTKKGTRVTVLKNFVTGADITIKADTGSINGKATHTIAGTAAQFTAAEFYCYGANWLAKVVQGA